MTFKKFICEFCNLSVEWIQLFKGVSLILKHYCQPRSTILSCSLQLTWTASMCIRAAQLEFAENVLVSYLPLSHVAAQLLDIYVPIICGATIYFAQPDALKVATVYKI